MVLLYYIAISDGTVLVFPAARSVNNLVRVNSPPMVTDVEEFTVACWVYWENVYDLSHFFSYATSSSTNYILMAFQSSHKGLYMFWKGKEESLPSGSLYSVRGVIH